uniref:Facilitated trehalose transporter Tret1 n=1 Tax=Cacopsylla melanoneura TaxID=428564 RepID=A0A8D8VR38_9HEMI
MFRSRALFRQYFAAAIATLSVMMAGTSMGWPSPVLRLFKENPNHLLPNETFIQMTSDQSSWVVSIIELGNLVTPIPFGFLVDSVGRKPCLLTTGPLYIISWLLVIFTKHVYVLYVVRFMQGLAMGIVFTVAPMYIGEIAGAKCRGALSTFFIGMLNTGILLEYLVGPFVDYDTLAYVSLVIPVVFLLTFIWMPESPYFLIMKERDLDAKKSLYWLRGGREASSDKINLELYNMKQDVEKEMKLSFDFMDIISTPANRRSLLIVQIVAVADVISGMSAVLPYASSTFARTEGAWITPDQCTLLLGVLVFLSTFPTAFLVDRTGRSPLLLVSCFGSGISQLTAGTYYLLTENYKMNLTPINWLPFTSITCFAVIYSIGLGPLVPTLQGEFFPSNTRGLAGGVTTITLTVISFLVMKMYQVIIDHYGVYLNYYIYSVGCIVCGVLVYFIIPESKGKTFAQIQDELNSHIAHKSKRKEEKKQTKIEASNKKAEIERNNKVENKIEA